MLDCWSTSITRPTMLMTRSKSYLSTAVFILVAITHSSLQAANTVTWESKQRWLPCSFWRLPWSPDLSQRHSWSPPLQHLLGISNPPYHIAGEFGKDWLSQISVLCEMITSCRQYRPWGTRSRHWLQSADNPCASRWAPWGRLLFTSTEDLTENLNCYLHVVSGGANVLQLLA